MKIDELFDIIPFDSGCYKKEPDHSMQILLDLQHKYNISTELIIKLLNNGYKPDIPEDDLDLWIFSIQMFEASGGDFEAIYTTRKIISDCIDWEIEDLFCFDIEEGNFEETERSLFYYDNKF